MLQQPRKSTAQIGIPIAIFIAAVSFWVALRSPYFEASEIEVKGNRLLSKVEVLHAAGLEGPINLLALRPGRVKARLERHPRVFSAEVGRVWPDKIVVQLQERVAVGAVAIGDALFPVDRQAVVMPATDPSLPRLPVVTGEIVRTAELGRPLASLRLRMAARAAGALGDSLRGRISEVHVDKQGELLLYTRHGQTVFLGTDERLAEKLALLQLILNDLATQASGARKVDLRRPDAPVVQ